MSHPTESQEQIAVIDFIKFQYPELLPFTIHIKNERKTSFYMGALNKRLGVLKGTPDLFIAWPTDRHHGLFIEMKSVKGRPTVEQKEFIDRANEKGYYATIAYGADEAINTIRKYLIVE
jgi:hypothetical protein